MLTTASWRGGVQNKTNSAVQLRHRPTGIVVKSQATRSRAQNRVIARSLLATRLDVLHNGAESRTAVVTAAKQKRKASATKKARRKYRKLDEEKDNGATVVAGAAEGGAAATTGVGTTAGAVLLNASGRRLETAEEDEGEDEEEEDEEKEDEENEDEEDDDNEGEVWEAEEDLDEKSTEAPKRLA